MSDETLVLLISAVIVFLVITIALKGEEFENEMRRLHDKERR